MAGSDDFYGRSPENEPAAASRTRTERDRDRILYSSAFARLSGITQVAAPETGHGFHSRLTHTLKVAQVAVRLAQRLLKEGLDRSQLDVDAVETAALAHDLGHPPFGHIAEESLNTLGHEAGGFEGNAQSFRIVTKLAVNMREPWGLNLDVRSLNALLKYPWLRNQREDYPDKWGAYSSEKLIFFKTRHGYASYQRSLEAQVMDWADDVTFAVHDLEDFCRAGVIPLERVVDDPTERARFLESIFERDPDSGDKVLRRNYARDGLSLEHLHSAAEFLFDNVFGNVEPYTGTRAHRVAIRRRSSNLIGRYERDVTAVGRPGATDGAMDLNIEIELKAQGCHS